MIKKSENLYQLSDSTHVFLFPEYEDLGNAGIIETDEGVVVIDNDVRSVDRLFATLPRITAKPVKFVINTHHAFDHSSANCIFAQKGATIIGSEKCREEMVHLGEENFRLWSEREPYIKKILEDKGISVALPQVTFNPELKLHLGKETLELYYVGHAHTPGDVVIYLPKEQILFGGDILWFGYYPNVREANVPNLIKAASRLLEFPAKYYVPGHGHISADRNEVVEMRDFLVFLWESIEKIVKEGRGLEELKKFEETVAAARPDWQVRRFLTRAVDMIYQALAGQSR